MRILDAELVTSAGDARAFPRRALPEVALIGRSNVGKSTLINALTRRRVARTSAAPGKTRLANFYGVRLARSPAAVAGLCFVDLPGYGYARGGEASARAFEQLAREYFEVRLKPDTTVGTARLKPGTTPEETPGRRTTPEETPGRRATPEETPGRRATPEETPGRRATPEETRGRRARLQAGNTSRGVRLPPSREASAFAEATADHGSLARRWSADRVRAALVLLLVDARHPGLRPDLDARAWLAHLGVPVVVVATKIDTLSNVARRDALGTLERSFDDPVLPVSADTGEGLDDLWKLILTHLNPPRPPVSSTAS